MLLMRCLEGRTRMCERHLAGVGVSLPPVHNHTDTLVLSLVWSSSAAYLCR